MDILANLTPQEQRALVHKLGNRRGLEAPGEEDTEDVLDMLLVQS